MPDAATHVASGKVREIYALDPSPMGRSVCCSSPAIASPPSTSSSRPRSRTRAASSPASPASGSRCCTPSSRITCCPSTRTGGRWSAGGSRCCRSSASCAATSPAPAGRTTRRPDRRRVTRCRRACASPTGFRSRSSRPRRRRRPATTRTSAATRRPSSSAPSVWRRWSASRSRCTRFAAEHARASGIIIADTKFELGIDSKGLLVLGDEALTPDSSRFWPADSYEPGRSQDSFDKQFVRDYCEMTNWNKTAPGPELPAEVVADTRSKYIEAFERLTTIPFPAYLENPSVVLG